MTEEGGDGFEPHAAVDGLGGEGVAQLVGVNVADTGALGDALDDAGHLVAAEGPPVLGDEPTGAVVGMGRGPLLEELDEGWS